jgi:hypothetical protein
MYTTEDYEQILRRLTRGKTLQEERDILWSTALTYAQQMEENRMEIFRLRVEVAKWQALAEARSFPTAAN